MRCGLVTLLFLFASTVAAAKPAPVDDACRGSVLELDRVAKKCRAKTPVVETRKPDALHIELAVPKPSMRPGETIKLVIRLVNTSDEPLPLDVDLGCSAFEPRVYAVETRDEQADWVDQREACKPQRPVHLTLDPHGAVSKTVSFTANMRAMEVRGLKHHARGSLPAGDYVIRIPVPFLAPGLDTPQNGKRISLEARMRVSS